MSLVSFEIKAAIYLFQLFSPLFWIIYKQKLVLFSSFLFALPLAVFKLTKLVNIFAAGLYLLLFSPSEKKEKKKEKKREALFENRVKFCKRQKERKQGCFFFCFRWFLFIYFKTIYFTEENYVIIFVLLFN